MRVDKSCEGCDHCSYEHFDDCGSFAPGYYCELDECPEEKYAEAMEEATKLEQDGEDLPVLQQYCPR